MLIALSFSLTGRNGAESNSFRDIVLQFNTYNGYGNNLYIDNVLTGIQADFDIMATSIINIPYDTNYSIKNSGSDTVSPVVSVANVGRSILLESDSALVYLYINGGYYFDSAYLPGMNPGQSAELELNPLIYTIGMPLYLKAYIKYNVDTARLNDTLRQYSIYLPGYERKVMFEEFTSNSSPACANNNQELNNFINNNFQNVCAIKYHLGHMLPDSFYMSNPAQNDERARYYFAQSVPYSVVDGIKKINIPYGDSINLYVPYFQRLSQGTPVNMTLTDERISGDSIKASINLNVISSLQNGNYKLRIAAVERYVFSEAANGERNFYDVFRRAYPDSAGIEISLNKGSYSYQYTYLRESNWVDSMIYTIAFIQNDDTKEILNCAKGRNEVYQRAYSSKRPVGRGSDYLGSYYESKIYDPLLLPADSIQSNLNVEIFEAYFPPVGWKVFNRDGNVTFSQFNGANGPTIGGSKSVIMAFFDYPAIGQKDSMYSKRYISLLHVDTLRFDYAYAQYGADYIDSLIVKISTDGGESFPAEIFRKGGFNLRTAPQTTSFFIPQNSTQWRSFKSPLSNFVNAENEFQILPEKFTLLQNYPNPFNPVTRIKYEIPYKEFVSLKVYDLLGQEIKTLVSGIKDAGMHEESFDGSSLSSGVYFYKIETQGFTDSKRMILIK
ncbi:MAG: hypothetical protein HGGPFJEG_00640 [Ignavibacteria bacterium]|nr:hypothetical protein [Ignavibacteria bacterium]